MSENAIFAELRARAGLSVKEVDEDTGYSIRQVYRWESGRSTLRKPVLDRLKELSFFGSSCPSWTILAASGLHLPLR